MFFMVVYFSSLAYKLTTIPTKVVARRMLPRLMSRFVLAEPSAEVNFLPHLLTPMEGITFSQVRLFYPVKFILYQERATERHCFFSDCLKSAAIWSWEQTLFCMKGLASFMIKRLLNDVLTIRTLRSNDADGNENVKKNNWFNKQKNNFARASRFFVHFFPVFALLRRENA